MPNGMLTSEQLAPVDGLYLAHPAAAGWNAMRAACSAATGVDLRIARPYGAYRSLTAQRVMYDDRDSYPVSIAKPGYSTHGTGMAVDATLASYRAARLWLIENCERFGFAVPTAWDPNHFAHRGTTPSGGIMTNVADIVKGVWARSVTRGTKKVTAIQELADTKSGVLQILARLDDPTPITLSDAQLDTLANKIAPLIKVPTKGTITLTQ